MQFLIFHLGADRYGLPTRDVRRVLPLMELMRLPGAPAFVAGLMNLHGQTVPVLDLCRIARGRDSAAQFDTRILLVTYRTDNEALPLGLIAERVSGMKELDATAFSEIPVTHAGAPWLGRVSAGEDGMLQLIEPAGLLDSEVCALLYPGGGARS